MKLLRYLLIATLASILPVNAAGWLPLAKSGAATLTYTVTATPAWSSGAGPFTSVNIGSVAADRTIIVTLQVGSNAQVGCQNGGGSAGPAPAVTVGGVTMNSVTQAGESTNGISCLYVYYLFAPSGILNATSATIAITCFNPSGGAAISVGTLTGSTLTSVNASNGNNWSGGGTVPDPRGVSGDLASVAVATGGVVVTGMGIDRTVTMTANSANTTVDFNSSNSGTTAFMAAHGTNGSPNFNGASNFNANFVIASFKP